jgi:hypothetical protein
MVLALSPEYAVPFASALDLSCNAKNDSTHYVRVPSDMLLDERAAARVEEALETAVIRSWQGPRWNRGRDGAASGKLAPSCPLHHYELAVGNAWCLGCDDVAPTL